VPEMLVALLADQKDVDSLGLSDIEDFTVGKNPKRNPLLRVFEKGVIYGNNAAILAGDEADDVDGLSDYRISAWKNGSWFNWGALAVNRQKN
jgi:hypothetical protein